MQLIRISNLDDPRLAYYRNLKDGELAAQGNRFIVEGHFVVQRLLVSDFQVDSVLVAERKVEEMTPYLREDVPVYVVSDALVKDIVGFKFHTGVIAVAQRKPPVSLDEVMSRVGRECTFVALPDTCGLQNMGSLIRVSAAFGVDAVLLGQRSVDPFYRLPIRVSMGTCFTVPIVRCEDLYTDLARLRDRWGVQLIATVLSDDAEPIQQAARPDRIALLFGGEGYGLDEQWVRLCDRKVTIDEAGHRFAERGDLSRGFPVSLHQPACIAEL